MANKYPELTDAKGGVWIKRRGGEIVGVSVDEPTHPGWKYVSADTPEVQDVLKGIANKRLDWRLVGGEPEDDPS